MSKTSTKIKTRSPTRSPTEDQIQRSVVDHLNWFAVDGTTWFHPANGGNRNLVEAAKFKGMGVVPGIPDLVIIKGTRNRGIQVYGLELKTLKGKQSKAQKEVEIEWKEIGCEYVVAHGLDEALDRLRQWGIIGDKPSGRARRRAERRNREADPSYVE